MAYRKANTGRSNSRAGKNSSFGKRQKADDDFRSKKKEGRSSDRPEGKREGPGGKRFSPRPRTEFKGSSYGAGKRKFSPGGSDEKKPFRAGGDRSFGKRSFDKKPFGKKSYGDRDEKKPFERKAFGDRDEKKPFERKPFGRKTYGDRDDKKPFERKSFGDRDEKKPFRKPSGERDSKRPRKAIGDSDEKKSFDRPFKKKPYEKKPYEKKSFVENKVDSHRERVEGPTPAPSESTSEGLIRLNKFISNSGVCSRREADELIKLGVVTVNGVTITEMGYKVKPTDDVRHEGKRLTAEKPVYILLNKPKGFITTTDDPQERNTVMQLIAGACKERVYPVGRLDRNTTGLLLLTNDGDLTDKLTHPSFNAKKIYKVELDKPLTKNDFQRIVDGIQLEEGKAVVDDLAIVSDDSMTVGIELHIGWNHIVRRIFDALEYSVVKLDRVVYAGLDKKDLKRGQWRFLKNDEIVRLKHFK